VLIREGYTGSIHATAGTVELATLVLLDSGHLHEEFAKREARWEKRHPDEVEADDAAEEAAYQTALELAQQGETGAVPDGMGETAPSEAAVEATASPSAEAPAPAAGVVGFAGWPSDPEATLRRQPPHVEIDLDAPLYTVDDAKRSLEHFVPLEYGEEREVAPGIHARFHDAGHILGSAIIELRVEEGGATRTIVCSGDLGRPGTPILRDPSRLAAADYVLVESTYGGREHEPQDEAIRILVETIHLVDEADGVLLVPSFAIGRTQEVVWELDRLIEQGKIPTLPLYLDSPMASKASDVYRHHPDYYDQETGALLRSGATPLDYPDQHVTNAIKDSQAIQRAPRPFMIVASNGMLTGGRVLGHLRWIIGDPTATILFVGYQGVGTLGSHLQNGAREVRLDGQMQQVRCNVRSISGFSAHADETELLDWLGRFGEGKQPGDPGYPRRIFLVHGDPEAQIALEPKVQALGFATHVPFWRERVTLD
jgi:metallo-beta-lactamase family protein